MTDQLLVRSATKQGGKHIRLGYNNQDARESGSFTIPSRDQTYRVGLVGDGCSSRMPQWSHTEVGANLSVVHAYARIQELAGAGVPIDEIPQVLFPSMVEFLRSVTNLVMPRGIVWKQPFTPKGVEAREGQNRFRNDYLAATLMGFICDGEQVVVFSAGDGVIVVNDDVTVIDQDDRPDYPVLSIYSADGGFQTTTYDLCDIDRLAVMTDGLDALAQEPQFLTDLFDSDSVVAPQMLLNKTHMQRPETMQDDCTVALLTHKTEAT